MLSKWFVSRKFDEASKLDIAMESRITEAVRSKNAKLSEGWQVTNGIQELRSSSQHSDTDRLHEADEMVSNQGQIRA